MSMMVFTILSVIGAAAAVVLNERANQLYVSCGVIFSVGVLIAGGFVHMLSDANEQFDDLDVEFQWAFAITGGTIVALYCFEVSMHRLVDRRNIRKIESVRGDVDDEPSLDEPDSGTMMNMSRTLLPGTQGNNEVPRAASTHDFTVDEDNPFSAVLLSIALSVHSIIEGMGIGASQDLSGLESAFVAVACHKMFVAFALANGLVESGYWREGKRQYFYAGIGTFILVCVLGVGIGWAIASTGNLMATAVLTAITGGTFLYAAILEVLPEQTKIIDEQKLTILPLVICFLLGYCLMSLLAVWA